MTSGPEWKLILLFTLPIMAGNFLQQLYNTVDGIVVGNFVGEDAFSAVGTCTPLTFLCLGIAIGLSVGVGVVISQYYGAQLHDKLNAAIDTALVLLGLIGVLIAAVAFLLTPWLLSTVLGVPENILGGAVVYFRIYACGLIFQFLYNGITAILRSMGDSRATLYFLIVSTTVNIILDLLFVIVFRWNVAGAAIATVLAQAACCTVSYLYLRRRFRDACLGRNFDRALCILMLKLGIPSAIQHSIVSVGNVVLQRLVNGFGPVSIAAYSAGNRIDSFMTVPIMGFQAGLSTFTGQNIGAGRLDRVRRGLRVTLVMSLTITLLFGILLYTCAGPVISFFGLSGASHARGVEQVHFLAFMFLIFATYLCACGVLQGSGDVLMQSSVTLIALVIRVAVSYTGVALGWFGYEAVWVTTPMGWGGAFIVAWLRYFTGGWKKKAVAGKMAGGAASDEV